MRDICDYLRMAELVQQSWIPDSSTFGARLALVRWHMGWNIAEAERECQLSQNTWGGYEKGHNPRYFVEVVNRIVLRTRVNKVWLMTGEGSPENDPDRGTMDYGDGITATITPITAARKSPDVA